MKLTIQDFGLYLGAPCRVLDEGEHGYFRGRIEGVSGFDSTLYPETHVDGDTFHADCVTLILRHINSLTEAEAKELYEVTHGRKFDMVVPPDLMSGQTALGWFRHAVYWRIDPMSANIGNTAAWRWLLAHHFDLFGWIEAGLALDAAKQGQPPKTD